MITTPEAKGDVLVALSRLRMVVAGLLLSATSLADQATAEMRRGRSKGDAVMKIIGTDNFARESVAEFLVADGLSETEAEMQVQELNLKVTDRSPVWYVVKQDDYKLWRGMEELI